MGQRGPKPKPVKLKLLAGNPGKRPATNARPASIRRGRPERPPELMGEAAAEWDRIVPDLDAAGLLALVDRAALAAYCLAWAELIAATQMLDEDGRIVDEPMQNARGEIIGTRKKAHPANRLQRDAFARVKTYIVEFGLTPAARGRLGDAGAPAEGAGGNTVLAIRDRIKTARG